MRIPFSTEDFLQNFTHYNLDVYPLQFLLYLLAVLILLVSFSKFSGIRSRAIFYLLALMWMWMGVVYHLMYFSAINQAAYLFGSLFIIQAICFCWYAWQIIPKIYFKNNTQSWLGVAVILFALVGYPLIGYFNRHIFPAAPTFGLPCPTTIFTFGVLLLSQKRLPVLLYVIPLLWSLIGFTAALKLGIIEDVSLPIVAVIFCAVIIYERVIQKKQSHAIHRETANA